MGFAGCVPSMTVTITATNGSTLQVPFWHLYSTNSLTISKNPYKKQHKCMLTKTKTFQSSVLCRRASSPTGSSTRSPPAIGVSKAPRRDAKAFPNCSTETPTSLASHNFDVSILVLGHPKRLFYQDCFGETNGALNAPPKRPREVPVVSSDK